MKLSELARRCAHYVVNLQGDCEVSLPFMDSRENCPGGLFFCISGARFDAHDFASQAVANGAAALVVERMLPLDVPQIQVRGVREAFGPMCAEIYGHPSERMKTVGLTGTKGKTTSSYLIKAILEAAGLKVGLIGTTGNMIGDTFLHGGMTTPEAHHLQALLYRMEQEKVQAVVMEVSAHAIDMHRIDGILFDVGCYTNLSQDHLDYFGTMDRYFEAKRSFFDGRYIRSAALNVDDERAGRILEGMKLPCLRYGISTNADLYARDIEISENGVNFRLCTAGQGEHPVHLQMTGIFNVYNALTAAAAAMSLGIGLETVVRGLESVKSVPGRAEVLETNTPYKVLLDYSHSPEALENILTAVRDFTRGRVIALFGCGGDRDHGKRPIMGEIGGRLADYCILTSDNPRNEDPFQILASVEEGIRRTSCRYTVIENRRQAIRHALSIAKEGDIVVLAGKGHETYQEIRGTKRPFNEKTVVRELLDELSREQQADKAEGAYRQ
ncbi:MAG: UDP-N-acetylmuramoyl-L-alanyl-D-glutamate--2,6-diaminopimelate ligase [Clostridia bacterium]|nr:UDP-N-acetylmuramoyl-L-alanyl-D-glutamate--2,6-diaminopimelate ligase [Clostridia bacterium]